MRRGDEELLDEIFFFSRHTGDAFAAALLALIGIHRHTLDITGVAYRNDDVLIGNQILDL